CTTTIYSFVVCSMCRFSSFFFFFFFQAEDGIRDFHVTGVQTCALPISLRHRRRQATGSGWRRRWRNAVGQAFHDQVGRPIQGPRSEERRVGKECRSRWWGVPCKKKKI